MDKVVALIRQGMLEQAESRLNELRANSPEWHCARGRLLEARGQTSEAREAYQAVLKMAPGHPEATFRLAYNYDLYGNDEEAIKLYESLAGRRPVPVNVLLNLAVLYEDRGQYEEALHCVNQVLMEYPNHQRARLFAKDIYSSMHMFYDETQDRDRQKDDAIKDTPISDFELSVRSRNCLRKMNINTLGDLLRITEVELMAYKNFGETSLAEIKAMLAQKGLHLGQFKEDPPRLSRPMAARRSLPDGSPEVLRKYLSEIELSSRSRKCLQRLNLLTVGDLIVKTEAELLAVKNFGQTSLNEIRQKLAELGLSLRKPE